MSLRCPSKQAFFLPYTGWGAEAPSLCVLYVYSAARIVFWGNLHLPWTTGAPLMDQQLALGCVVPFTQVKRQWVVLPRWNQEQCFFYWPLQGCVIGRHCLAASQSPISTVVMSYLRNMTSGCMSHSVLHATSVGAPSTKHTLSLVSSLRAGVKLWDHRWAVLSGLATSFLTSQQLGLSCCTHGFRASWEYITSLIAFASGVYQ